MTDSQIKYLQRCVQNPVLQAFWLDNKGNWKPILAIRTAEDEPSLVAYLGISQYGMPYVALYGVPTEDIRITTKDIAVWPQDEL